jgi:putative membrane protein
VRSWSIRTAVLLVAGVGLAVAVTLLAAVGIGDVLAAVVRIGVLGFLLYTGYSFVILAILGLAWLAVAPGLPLVWWGTFFWGRTTREAATDVLPFAQIGGIVIGARTIVARGVPQPLAYASLVADQTTELAAQLVYTLYGVAMLALVLQHGAGSSAALGPALAGLGISTAIMIAFAVAQRPLLAFSARIGAALLPGASGILAQLPNTLDAIYRKRRRVIASFLLHIVTWVGSGAGAWIALHLIGAAIPVGDVIVIESLIFTLRTAAFLIPGGIGVQEAAYVLIGPLFGLPAEAALALSLLKRARDLMIGLPVVLIWLSSETRHKAELR